MTQEEKKELLLKDLCARLPYRPIVYVDENLPRLKLGVATRVWEYIAVDKPCKPYLRPMSSMTEEECDIVEEILGDKCIFDFMSNGDIILKQGQFSQNKLAKLYDYYNLIHVDYRGLIKKDLALEAPEGMYK